MYRLNFILGACIYERETGIKQHFASDYSYQILLHVLIVQQSYSSCVAMAIGFCDTKIQTSK